MPARAWLTPDDPPADFICRELIIPNDRAYIAIVTGALELLINPENFELYGDATPEDTASVFRTMFDKFSLEGECRVVGEIIWYAGYTIPNPKWLFCAGNSLLRADYPELFAAIGTVYGADDGDHFNLPDYRGRAPIGIGQGTGLTNRNLGEQVGTETHTLNINEMPVHNHADTGHLHTDGIAVPALGAAMVGVPIPSAIPGIASTGVGYANIGANGYGYAHNNMQPSIGCFFLICAKP